jgi:hypothetical protein
LPIPARCSGWRSAVRAKRELKWHSLAEHCFELLDELIVLFDCSLGKLAYDGEFAGSEFSEILVALGLEGLNEKPDFF